MILDVYLAVVRNQLNVHLAFHQANIRIFNIIHVYRPVRLVFIFQLMFLNVYLVMKHVSIARHPMKVRVRHVKSVISTCLKVIVARNIQAKLIISIVEQVKHVLVIRRVRNAKVRSQLIVRLVIL